MEILVTARPQLLLETVELLYAYMNDIPPEALTEQGEYCLPPQAIREMMDVACAGISQIDPTMLYYFGEHQLTNEQGCSTCIARNLAYNAMELSRGSVAAEFASRRAWWQDWRQSSIQIDHINEFCLSYMKSKEARYVPMARSIFKLAVSQEYAQMLLEQFSGYEDAISRLERLVTPVAEKLEPLLLPWVQNAEPLVQLWEQQLNCPEKRTHFLSKRVCIDDNSITNTVHIQLRYLLPKKGPTNWYSSDDEEFTLFAHMGVAVPVEKKEECSFEPWEFDALRLMGTETRMRMLRLMLDNPMSARELSKALGLHLGTICRDLNSLYDAALLVVEMVNGRKRYRTNMDMINTLGTHILELKQFNVF
ncbi:MAG: winged helix-turn-helix transcriptional regulator [Oscillospiraceae bacterium]|nr:winged helix-turn-helix transcriptional regulator [Oscillospiraceae bacterium]